MKSVMEVLSEASEQFPVFLWLVQDVMDVVSWAVLHFVVDVTDIHTRYADGEDDETANKPDGQQDEWRPPQYSCTDDDGIGHIDANAEGYDEEGHADLEDSMHGTHAESSDASHGQMQHLVQRGRDGYNCFSRPSVI